MEVTYQQGTQQSLVVYGETLAALLPSLNDRKKHLIVITNQRYYDLFSAKINQLLPTEQMVDWYICTNQTHCNNLSELTSLLQFLTRFSKAEEYVFLAFGNEGVVELTGYVQKNTLLTSSFWLLPVSIRSFAQGLLPANGIVAEQEQPVLQAKNLPQLILYDQTLTNQQTTGKMVDLLIFIVCGILGDRQFLNELYFNYPSVKKLQQTPFNAMIEPLVRFYEADAEQLGAYGQVFEEAFYQTEGGHLFSGSMKRMLGILFHFSWNLTVTKMDFRLDNFLGWLMQLGYPLALPPEFLVGDYVEKVLRLLSQGGRLLYLENIGQVEGSRQATAAELLTAMANYQKNVESLGEG